MKNALIILDGRLPPASRGAGEWLDLQAFVQKAYEGYWWRRLRSYDSVRLLTVYPECLPRRSLLLLLLRLLSRRECEVQGADGRVLKVTWRALVKSAGALARDALGQYRLLWATWRRVREAERLLGTTASSRRLSGRRGVLYLKTDLWLGVPAGGSVTHMAGVANELARHEAPLEVWSASVNPLLRASVDFQQLQPPRRFWDFREAPLLAFNASLLGKLKDRWAEENTPGWIYQRYSLHNFSGAWAAIRFSRPLVLEYNGSEVWMGEHWGSGLRWRALADRTERLNLLAADVVVVVSEASMAELVSRGVDAQKILVNPNGVDVERYSPDVPADEVLNHLGWRGKTVIGFIGTFGRWHGAEVLVEAFARLCRRHPGSDSLRLLLVGDGPTRSRCEELAREWGVAGKLSFPGLVAQVDGPKWLAACDVLVAPHVPNEDGSVFFGSPTKIFEYMAMRRPIVASRLGQLAQVLRHGETAWLVEPGRAQPLEEGLSHVLGDLGLREQMARNARREAVDKYTWQAHARRIVEKLQTRCG